jgi:hypothetical protein
MYSFPSTLKVNTDLQFCLAQQKPDGSATNGIERRLTTVSSFSTNDNMKHYSTGGLDAWDPTKYMNIWVCNLGSSLCGYAQFPTTGINGNYGVAINYLYFGTTGASAPYNLGGTASHEIGHCFNLYHIWGDDGTACTGTDNCGDTPNQAGPNYGMPAFPHVTCSNGTLGDMFMNFMDYSDDAAYTNFTPNQKSRIQALFGAGGLLYSLTTSQGCVAPNPNLCNAPSGLNATGITTTAATLNWTAAANATAYNVQYRMLGAASWTSFANVTGTSQAINGLSAGSGYEFQVQTICSATSTSSWSASTSFATTATGCTDIYEANNTQATAKTIAVGTNISALIGSSTDVDYFKFSNTAAQKKIRITLTNLPADYDVRLYKSNGTQVGISQNAGTTAETIVYNNGAAGTYYVKVYGYNGAYNATSCYTLKAEISASNFKTTDDELLGIEPVFADFTIYPNPTSGILTVDFMADADQQSSINIMDITGKLVYSEAILLKEGQNQYQLNLTSLQKGLYFVEMTSQGQKLTQTLVIE